MRRNLSELTKVLVAGAVGAVLTNLLGGVGVFAQKRPPHRKLLRAERFELVDQSGKSHAALSFDLEGRASLALFSKTGSSVVTLMVGEEGEPSLDLYDQGGKARVALSLLASGEPSLNLHDEEGKRRAALGLRSDGEPLLVLADKNEMVQWKAP